MNYKNYLTLLLSMVLAYLPLGLRGAQMAPEGEWQQREARLDQAIANDDSAAVLELMDSNLELDDVFLDASSLGAERTVAVLLEQGPGQDAIDQALINAACYGYERNDVFLDAPSLGAERIVAVLLEQGPGQDAIDQAFINAACYGYEPIVSLLLQRNPTQKFIFDALGHAANQGQQQLVEILLRKNPRLEYEAPGDRPYFEAYVCREQRSICTVSCLLPPSDESRWALDHALVQAAEGGHEHLVSALLERFPDAMALSAALRSAALAGHKRLVELLLQKAPENVIDHALLKGSADGNTALIRLILEDNPFIDISGPLINAAYGGHKQIVWLLLNMGPKLISIQSALSRALEQGHQDVVALLFQQNPSKKMVAYVLHTAARLGERPLVEALLKLSPDREAINVAFMQAASNGHEQLAISLLRDPASGEVNEALQSAGRCGSDALVRLLLKRGPSQQGIDDALCLAAGISRDQATYDLLKEHATPAGIQAAQAAVRNKFFEGAQILTKYQLSSSITEETKRMWFAEFSNLLPFVNQNDLILLLNFLDRSGQLDWFVRELFARHGADADLMANSMFEQAARQHETMRLEAIAQSLVNAFRYEEVELPSDLTRLIVREFAGQSPRQAEAITRLVGEQLREPAPQGAE